MVNNQYSPHAETDPGELCSRDAFLGEKLEYDTRPGSTRLLKYSSLLTFDAIRRHRLCESFTLHDCASEFLCMSIKPATTIPSTEPAIQP